MAPPSYPETIVVRGGPGIQLVRPLMFLVIAPFLMPIGIYGLTQRSWGMAAFFLVPPLLGILMFAPSVARAGSFELTTHRLTHKPWFRQPRSYPLGALTDLRFDASSARVRDKGAGLDLAFAGSFDTLRGALSVWTYLARLPFPAPGHEPIYPWAMWPVRSKTGRSGFAIVVGDLVTFVPENFPPPSAARTAAGLAVTLLTLPLGVVMVPSYVIPPVADVLRYFHSAPQSVRLFALESLAALMGGWAVGAARARSSILPGAGGSAVVTLEVENEDSITGPLGADVAQMLHRRLPNASAAPQYR